MTSHLSFSAIRMGQKEKKTQGARVLSLKTEEFKIFQFWAMLIPRNYMVIVKIVDVWLRKGL